MPPFLRSKRVAIAAIAALFALGIGAVLIQAMHDPAAPFLRDRGDGVWIVADEPIRLRVWDFQERGAVFRRDFTVDSGGPVSLEIMAARHAFVRVDGQEVQFEPSRSWKMPAAIPLPPTLEPGMHTIEIGVTNTHGPPALWLDSPIEALRSSAGWRVLSDAGDVPAVRATQVRRSRLSTHYGPVWNHIGTGILLVVPVALLAALLAAAPQLSDTRTKLAPWAKPEKLRFVLMAVLALMGLNNAARIDLSSGFDAQQHYEYILFVYENLRIPLATDGWQMFQAPLFYMVGAVAMGVFAPLAEMPTPLYILRALPILCGIVQVEIVYRAVRLALPDSANSQRIGLIVGALVPVNLYMTQFVSNEPLAAVLTGASVLAVLGMLVREEPPGLSAVALWGLLVGAALLTKSSAALLIPPGAIAIAGCYTSTDRPFRSIAAAAGVSAGAVFLVAGWYYVRNWVLLGAPFVGGWDPSRGFEWYQDPGYRTLAEYLRFGEGVVRPVTASTAGFLDGLYSTFWTDAFLSGRVEPESAPPWNVPFLMMLAPLSLLPCGLAAIGFGKRVALAFAEAAWSVSDRLAAYLTGVLALYILAVLYLHVSLPIYSTSKGSYLLGLVCALGIFTAWGFDALPASPVLRRTVEIALVCWAAVAVAAFTAL